MMETAATFAIICLVLPLKYSHIASPFLAHVCLDKLKSATATLSMQFRDCISCIQEDKGQSYYLGLVKAIKVRECTSLTLFAVVKGSLCLYTQ